MRLTVVAASVRHDKILRARAWRVLALIAVLLVFAYRVHSTHTTYMRPDEEIAFRTTARDLQFAVWYQAEQDVHAPIWFASFWAWQQVAGSTEFTARVYSILLSTLALALLYQAGRRWFDHPRFGVFVVAVAGVNAYAHIYALEIRPYALVMLLTAANMLLFRRWLVRPSWPRALAYGASVALMLWTHYFLAFLVLAQVAYLVVSFRPEQAGGGLQPLRTRAHLLQALGAAGLALLLWLPWLPVFWGQIETLRRLELESGAFRGPGIGNTTTATTLDVVWQQILLMTNGQPLLYALPLVAALLFVRKRAPLGLALAWALGVPAVSFAVNLFASVYTPRYISYASLGVALVVGVGLAALPRWRWLALAVFCAFSLWALPSQFPANRIPYRDIFQRVSALAESEDAVYFIRADDADLFTRWQIDHYLAPELRANKLDSFEQARSARAVWFITGDYFDESVQARFRQLEATHPLHAVVGDCNRHWCFVAQRLVGPPEREPQTFDQGLGYMGVSPVVVGEDSIFARLWWRTSQPLNRDYSISLQLVDANGVIVAQQDGPLNPDAEQPIQTSYMLPGHVYTDDRTLAVAGVLAPGEYQLLLVVYQSWDGVRLTLQGGSDTLLVRAFTVS